MRGILAPMNAAAKICQKASPTVDPCRLSIHVLSVPCEDGTLFYHTLTGELLLLSPEEAQQTETDEALRRDLFERRFLVPVSFDEYAYSRQFRRIAKLLTPPQKLVTAFTVFTTTDCNARCAYCYELGRPRFPMSDQVARDAARFIARVCGGEEVKLTWFGGEPLYNPSAIRVLTEELQKSGVSYRSVMITNGLLFDRETVDAAKRDWNLQRVQITLDGTEEVYNRTKNYVDAEGSAYLRVLHNVELLLKAGVWVTIRLNAHSGNMEDLCDLTDELALRFKGEKRLRLYSVLLRDFGPAGSHPEVQAKAMQSWDALQRRILTSGIGKLNRPARQLQTNGCMADSDGSLTILPDGRLGKCEHESEQHLVGNIYDGITDPDTVARWKERVEVPECAFCAFSPTCSRLQMCAWTNGQCTDADRERIRLSVSRKVLTEYHYYLTKGNREGDEPDETETDVDF